MSHSAGGSSSQGDLSQRAAAEQLHDRLLQSLDALRELDLGGPSVESVSRLSFAPGAVVLREDEPSDAVFFVLKGVALAVRRRGGARRELARVGPGQCFGERGVLQEARRSADIVAETALEVVRVEASRFLAWCEERPEIRDFLGALEQVYWLEEGRPLSVYRSVYEGRLCVSTVYGDLASDGIVSTKVLGEDIFVLSRATVRGESDEREVEFFASGRMWRALHLEEVVRSASGLIQEASLAGVLLSGVDADVGAIYQRVLRGGRLNAAELARFRTTGHLGGHGRLSSESIACQCLGLSREAVLEAGTRHDYRYEAVRRAIGAGVVCGGCVPAVRELLRAQAIEVPRASGTTTAPACDPPTGARPRLTVRRFEPRYDPSPLAEIRGDHQVHLIAIGSLVAGCGERFMIGTMLQAAPSLRDPGLIPDLEAFLQQESNHVSAHEPLNRLLADRIYADCPALQAMRRLAFTRLERASLGLKLAVCAAFEFVADCLFELHFETRNVGGGAHHPDVEVEKRLEASGVLALFLWHGIEELGHRHVAFDVMKDRGVGYGTRAFGMLLTLWELSRVTARVLPELAWKTTRGRRRSYLLRALLRPAFARRLPLRLLRFFAPGFHPSRLRYPYLEDLETLAPPEAG